MLYAKKNRGKEKPLTSYYLRYIYNKSLGNVFGMLIGYLQRCDISEIGAQKYRSTNKSTENLPPKNQGEEGGFQKYQELLELKGSVVK